jgi:hypothetical protein
MASASGICSTLFAATCRYQHFIYSTNNENRNDDDATVAFGECQTNNGLNLDGSKCECLAPFGFKQVILYCYSCLALGIFYAVPLRRILLEKMDVSLIKKKKKKKRSTYNQHNSKPSIHSNRIYNALCIFTYILKCLNKLRFKHTSLTIYTNTHTNTVAMANTHRHRSGHSSHAPYRRRCF